MPVAQFQLKILNTLSSRLVCSLNTVKNANKRDTHWHMHFFVSAFLRDYSLCWDRWKQYMTPTLDAALLISSRAGADLGRTSDSRV